MNAEEARKAAAVMVAWAEGQPIECRCTESITWGAFPQHGNGIWNFDRYEYRIKPQPREWWIVKRSNRTDAFYNKPPLAADDITAEIIHVREVLE